MVFTTKITLKTRIKTPIVYLNKSQGQTTFMAIILSVRKRKTQAQAKVHTNTSIDASTGKNTGSSISKGTSISTNTDATVALI